MSSPFDDDQTEAPPPPKRKRRPWWRWNLISLMILLFLLVWVRELGRLHYSQTWAIAVLALAAWALVPLFVLSAIEPEALLPTPRRPRNLVHEDPHNLARGYRDDGWLGLLRALAVVGVVLSVLHFVASILAVVVAMASNGPSFIGYGWISLANMLVGPFTEFLLSAVLYVLVVIATRLGDLANKE